MAEKEYEKSLPGAGGDMEKVDISSIDEDAIKLAEMGQSTMLALASSKIELIVY